jgi:type II secretory pathway component PulM
MSGYFSRLNPSERRFVVGVGLVFFVVINLFWIWPHFSDWGKLQARLRADRFKLANDEAVIRQVELLKPELARLEKEGASVPVADQAIDFMRTIQLQAQQSGMGITSYGHQTFQTNQFFNEQSQTISGIAGEKQLVDFLYRLGAGNSLVRVKAISVRPDPQRQQLSANITLVASYQKTQKSGAPSTREKSARPQPGPAAVKSPSALPTRPPGATQPPRPNRPQAPRPPNSKPATPTKK